MFYLGGDERGKTVSGICCMKTIFSIKEALLITNTQFRQTHLTTLTQSLILSKASHSYPLWSSPLVTWCCSHNRRLQPSKALLSSRDSHHWTIGSVCRWLSPRNNHETTFSLQTPMADHTRGSARVPTPSFLLRRLPVSPGIFKSSKRSWMVPHWDFNHMYLYLHVI